jgi:hypothetical protein
MVREPLGQTTLQVASPADLSLLGAGAPLPAPVALNPPPAPFAALPAGESACPEVDNATEYYEALEGMLVQVPQGSVVVGPTNHRGETVLVRPEAGVARLFREDTARAGLAMVIDDGSNTEYRAREEMPYALRTGEQVQAVTGPLATGGGAARIQPLQPPAPLGPADPPVADVIAPAGETELSIMTWNAGRLFAGNGGEGTPLRLARAAAAILLAGAPDVIALQGIDDPTALKKLAAEGSLAAYGYEVYPSSGQDARTGTLAFLVRAGRVEAHLTALPEPARSAFALRRSYRLNHQPRVCSAGGQRRCRRCGAFNHCADDRSAGCRRAGRSLAC